MKKSIKVLAVVLTLVALVLSFSACTGEKGEFRIVVIRDGKVDEYVLDSTGSDMNFLIDAFVTLQSDTESEFSYALSGTFLSMVNGYTAVSSNNEFWAIYTDCEIDGLKYYDLSWGEVDYDGASYASALKGITELPLNGGTTYIVKLSTY